MNKEKLRVKFVDFWTDMDRPEGNFFYQELSRTYSVEFSDNPEVVFYSCFGNSHLAYTCTRIFYSTENWRANFSRCDYAITFDFIDNPRHLRWPLWTIYYPTSFVDGDNLEERFSEWSNRKNFCCIIVSNPNASERIDFFHKLNDKLKVDSAGKWNHTVGKELLSGSKNKVDFIKDYRFVISFQNSSHPGYTTEKLVEPILAGCIPIYWGDPKVGEDFNVKRFIHMESPDQVDQVIERILAVEKNKSLAKQM